MISYIALFYIVHLEALKLGMQPIARERKPLAAAAAGPGARIRGTLIGVCRRSITCRRLRPLFGDGRFVGHRAAPRCVAYVGPARVLVAATPICRRTTPTRRSGSCPTPWPTVHAGLHFLLPIGVLVWCLMIEELSPGLSAFWATVAAIAIMVTQRPLFALFRGQGDRRRVASRLRASRARGLVDGARNMIGIARRDRDAPA